MPKIYWNGDSKTSSYTFKILQMCLSDCELLFNSKAYDSNHFHFNAFAFELQDISWHLIDTT